ncbi:hypothetical protein JW949_04490 [Candidatus Woesearchaeota archaeon]|nr:hypothetical protein [Candidatus Woesearchaeota archaeon]
MQKKTKLGYDLYEVISALQKSIRRGKEKDALWWAFELCESELINIVLARLRVIAYEDIGVGDTEKALFALKALDDLEKWYPDNWNWRLALSSAVMALCRADKSRDTCTLPAWLYYKRRKNEKMQIPDYALDSHTIRGKKMNRGMDFFYNEGAKIEPDKGTKEYTEKAKEAYEWAKKNNISLYDEGLKKKSKIKNKEDEEKDGDLGEFFEK